MYENPIFFQVGLFTPPDCGYNTPIRINGDLGFRKSVIHRRIEMTNEEREAVGLVRWESYDRIWQDGISSKRIAKWMNFSNVNAWRVRKNEIRKKYPYLFKPRPQGFIPIDANWDEDWQE